MSAKFAPVIHVLRPGQFPGITFEAADGKEGNPDEKPEEFTPAQQTKVQALIDAAVGRANKAAEKKQTEANTAWEKRLKALEDAKPKEDDDDGKKEKTIPVSQLAQLKKDWEAEQAPKFKDMETRIESLMGEKKRAAILSEAARLKVVDAEMVAELTAKHIAFDDDGGLVVRGADGKERFGKEGLMTVGEFLADWTKDKPYLLASEAKPGGGSGAPRGGIKQSTAGMTGVDLIAAALNEAD